MKPTPIKLTEREFSTLATKAGIGKHAGQQAWAEAARLYFVEGEPSIAAAAKKAGCHRNNAGTAVRKILKVLDDQEKEKNTELVTVRVPRGKRRALQTFAKALMEEMQ